ncbi:MAG: class I SAM-dependent methyltransferase [Actinomycetota bacterium]
MTLSHDEARTFYDRFGSKQDWQRFYEDRAIANLIGHALFEKAGSVLEFGCGTGRLAETLLVRHLPPTARYLALDTSATMISLARKRLTRFGDRVAVLRTDGDMHLQVESGTYDRLLSSYVLDLLTDEDIHLLIKEAHRVLSSGGFLAISSLTHGSTFIPRLIEKAWGLVYASHPSWVGGCRPISVMSYIDDSEWNVFHHAEIIQCGITSEVVVAERKTA